MLSPDAAREYERRMSARLRKLVGMIGILAFLVAYVAVVATLSDRLPRAWWVQVIYFGLAGVLWGVPLFPLISWMNRGR